MPRWVALPGMVNAHDHLHLNAFGRLRFRRRYDHAVDWARDMAARMEQPAIAAMRAVPREARAWHGAFKNAVSGAVLVVHHDPPMETFGHPDFPVTIVGPYGWAHSVPHGDRLWSDDAGRAPAYGPELRSSAADTPPGRPWYVHAAEGTDARAAAELAILTDAGCVGPMTRLVHGVGLGAAGAARAKEAGAALIWCPSANQFLLGAVAPVAPFLPDGLALGTDSRLTGGRDLLDELSLAATHRSVSSADLLDALTVSGRRLVGAPEIDPDRLMDLLVLPANARVSPSRSASSDTGGHVDGVVRRLATARRADLGLVTSRGRTVIADPSFASAFVTTGEPFVEGRLDGRDKLLAPWLLHAWGAAGIREPGFEAAGRAGARCAA